MLPIIGDDYRVHQEVRKHFERPQRVLFQQTDCCLMALSENSPAAGVGRTKEINVDELCQQGEQYMFNVRLNPAIRNKKTGKREAISPNKLQGWVANKLSSCGVTAEFKCLPEGVRKSVRGDSTISLNSVMVVGFLTVKDSALFKAALEHGIGHAKGFGFGLLNVFN